MKINVIGNGVFGTFFKDVFEDIFDYDENANTIVMAVPFDSYEDVARKNREKHLVNICSIQKASTDICKRFTDKVTSIHPLFGPRTPKEKRNAAWTYQCGHEEERDFVREFSKKTKVWTTLNGEIISSEKHDKIMVKTHVAFVNAALDLKRYVEDAEDVPDEFIPHSFRKMRELVKQLEDMPEGTLSSIMANTFI